jgi:hypothetical protein
MAKVRARLTRGPVEPVELHRQFSHLGQGSDAIEHHRFPRGELLDSREEQRGEASGRAGRRTACWLLQPQDRDRDCPPGLVETAVLKVADGHGIIALAFRGDCITHHLRCAPEFGKAVELGVGRRHPLDIIGHAGIGERA